MMNHKSWVITCGKTHWYPYPLGCALAHRKHSLQQITISSSSLHATNFHEVKLPRLETCSLEQTLQALLLMSQNIWCNVRCHGIWVSALKRSCPSGPPFPWSDGRIGMQNMPLELVEPGTAFFPPSFKVRLVQCCDCRLSLNGNLSGKIWGVHGHP